eukprot:30294-Pelagococcus_subviridis.AAC.5
MSSAAAAESASSPHASATISAAVASASNNRNAASTTSGVASEDLGSNSDEIKSTPPARYTAPTAELTPRVVPSPALRLGVDAGDGECDRDGVPIGGSTGVPTEHSDARQFNAPVNTSALAVDAATRSTLPANASSPSATALHALAFPFGRAATAKQRHASSITGACVESNSDRAAALATISSFPRRSHPSGAHSKFPKVPSAISRTRSCVLGFIRSVARASGRRLFTRHGAFSADAARSHRSDPLSSCDVEGVWAPRSGGSTSAVMSAMTRSSSSVDAPTPSSSGGASGLLKSPSILSARARDSGAPRGSRGRFDLEHCFGELALA